MAKNMKNNLRDEIISEFEKKRGKGDLEFESVVTPRLLKEFLIRSLARVEKDVLNTIMY